MKFLIKLDIIKIYELFSRKDVYGVSLIDIDKKLKKLLTRAINEYVDMSGNCIIGISKLCGESEDNLLNNWYDLVSLCSIREGDYVLEFDYPSDSLITLSYETFLEINKNDIDSKQLKSLLCFSEHTKDDTELIIVPFLNSYYCTGIYKVNKVWDLDIGDLKEISKSFMESGFFNKEVKSS